MKNEMKQVAVIHAAFGDVPHTVAFVNVPEDYDVTEALEYAYRRTQNIEGSWSKGKTFEWDGEVYDNPDFSEDVTVMAPLHERDGKTYGLRSTSMGDQMLFGVDKYEVSAFGFEKVA